MHMKQENGADCAAQADWLQVDPIHERLVEELDRRAEAGDFRAVDESFDAWYVLKAGVPLEDAVRAFLKSDAYRLPVLRYSSRSFRFCIRITDDGALPRDPAERERLFAFCDKNRISVITAGSDDYHFYDLCERRACFVFYDEVYGSWDELRLQILPD